VTFAFIIAGNASSQLRPSWSFGYDFLPYQGIDEPIEMPDGTMVDDAEVRLSKFRTAFTYPVLFSRGKTILLNEISYQHIRFDYHRTTSLLEKLHSVGYTLTMLHYISDKWSLLAIGKSSLASDLEVDISMDDFSFQAATIFNSHFGQRISIGFGAAYSTQFGSAVPIPLLALDWNNGAKWSAKAILPSSLEVWYNQGQRIDLGLLVTGDGDNYRFDPGSYRDTSPEPELRYTMMTIGLASKIDLYGQICLNIEAGIIGLHRFEFYSGDEEVVSNDLKPSQYIRLGLQSNL
jgi:hypothetical protein